MGVLLTLGDHINTQKGYAFKSKWFADEGNSIVKVSDFTADSIDPSNLVKISDELASDYQKYRLETGDVVIQTVGSWPSNPASVVGKTIKVPKTVAGALLNQNAVRIEPEESLHKGFLYYLLRSEHFKEYIIGTAQGAASQASITLEAIKGYKFECPSYEVQTEIAEALATYDNLIENNNRRIAILEDMAQSLYREWFVKFRFPDHENVKFKDSPLGQIPEGWEILALEDISEKITDGAHKSPKSVTEGIPMASVKDMHDFGINEEKCRHISESDYLDLVRQDSTVKANDILVAKDGSYLKHTFVVEKELRMALLSSIAMIRPNDKVRPHWLAYCLRSSTVKDRMKQCVSGVAIPRIILKDFRNFKIYLPDQEIMSNWNGLVQPMIEECWNLIARNKNLKTQRDMLLPKLISGKINLKD